MELLFLVLYAVLATANANPYFFVVAPNAFRYEHEETVVVNIFGTSNQNVDVWLEANGKEFGRQTVFVPSESQPQTIKMKATEEDIFDKETSEKAAYVKLVAQSMGQTQNAEVLMNYDSGYLIIQTDKPLYSPEQKVKYRVLALTEDIQHAKDILLSIDIIDPKNRTIRREEVVWGDIPLFEDFYVIPSYADLQRWTIRAHFKGQFRTEARATFLVEEYELPTYGVEVTVNEQCVLEDTGMIEVKVESRYVYDKPVVGTAGLEVILHHDEQEEMSDGVFLMSMDRQFLADGAYTFRVDMNEVLNSQHMPASVRDFPGDGYYLHLRADVHESVTGNEEVGTGKIIFADKPYIFKFDDSQETYRPSLVFTLQVELLHANGVPVDGEFADLEMVDTSTGQVKAKVAEVTKGKVIGYFSTIDNQGNPSLEFTVKLNGVTSDIYSVQPYQGVDQVQVGMVIHEGQPQLRVFGNANDQNTYSGFILMILSKGTIVWQKHYSIKLQEHIPLDNSVQELISPSARAIVYFVKKTTGEVVTDSTKFELTPRCRGKGLTLSEDKQGNGANRPSSVGTLDLSGEAHMHVGLNAMDTALLLLDSENVIKQNTMFKKMTQHDLGCGAGGGQSSSDVFKRAGLVVLSNANVNSVKRTSIACDANSRKRRSAEDCYADDKCCSGGFEYGMLIYEENQVFLEHAPELAGDLLSKCYAKALELTEEQLKTICVQEFLVFCRLAITELDDSIHAKSGDDDSDYVRDLADWGGDEGPKIRDNFKDSWLFDYKQLDKHGNLEVELLFPDSITTWLIQGVGFSSKTGVCIAEPIEVKVFRDFFVQLDLPYSAVRLENINIQATVFNYYARELKIRVYLEGQENLCSNAKPGRTSPRQETVVAGNDATTFTFLVMPLKAGSYDIVVKVLAKAEGVYQDDAVSKKLLVVNEGQEELKTIHVCLDPLHQNKGCGHSNEVIRETINAGLQTMFVSLMPPPDFIPKTVNAVGYISSNIMTNVVEKVIQGTEKFIRMPWGCGEQTMIGLAPMVYAMNYLKQTKQTNEEIERNGNNFIRAGVERELSYRHGDFSYAAFKHRTSSTWLTAFVMKVFCQANKAVDGSVNEQQDILPTLQFLLKRQTNGMFEEKLAVNHRSMMGQVSEHDLSLTAYIITSFLECDSRTKLMNATIAKSIELLEGGDIEVYKNNPYHLAIITYALGMADSPKKWDFMKALQSIAQNNDGKLYWGAAGGSAQTVETTAYALLAHLTFRLHSDSGDIVKWLLLQRQAGGAFRSTQDTVVGLQALSAYNVITYIKDVNLQVKISNKRGVPVTNANAQVIKVMNNLLGGKDAAELSIQVNGTGSALLDIEFTYNMPAEDKPCPFTFSDIDIEDISEKPKIDFAIGQRRRCDVCDRCEEPEDVVYDDDDFVPPIAVAQRRRKRASRKPRFTTKKYCVNFTISSEMESSGMTIVKVGLQTGMRVIQNDLEILLNDNPLIARYELPADGKGHIIFYLTDFSDEKVDFKFRLEDGFLGDKNTRQMAKVDVFEYYDPDRVCTRFYSTENQLGKPLPYECDAKGQTNCVCLNNVCADDFNKKYIAFLRSGRRPVADLYKRLCVTDKADYAVLVRVDTHISNLDTQIENATATILDIVFKGTETSQKSRGDSMFFRWQSFCPNPTMEVGKKYYIINKDGFQMTGPDGKKRYVNELMDSAVVIEKTGRGKLRRPLMRFAKEIRKGCKN